MNILLKNVIIADSHSIHNNTGKDIFIKEGIVTRIANGIVQEADVTIEGNNNVYISSGFVDVVSHFSDPGFEQKETLETGARSAAAGGFTQVFLLPNTAPAISTKSGVEYIVEKAKGLPVSLRPLGTITKQGEGKELAEMYDMHSSGAVAFTDGLQPVQSSQIMLKALQYVKSFEGVIVQIPIDKNIAAGGLMHEGIVSTKLGLQGIPSIGEEVLIARDIALLKYTNSKLHITGVSTSKGIELIRAAKADGLPVTCSVTPYHLYFCDEDLEEYDTNLKVAPPLRGKDDREALRHAIWDGTVDCIASHHNPQHWDDKVCEFEYAKPGMIGLQTSFAVVHSLFPQLAIERLVQLFSFNARSIFNLPHITVEEGAEAEFTLFSKEENTVLTKENSRSKSANSPFLNVPLQGKIKGIIHKSIFK